MSTKAPPRLPPGERLRRAGIAAWSIIGISIVVAIALWLLYEVRVIFPPLVLALLIIYVLNPIVTRLQERGVRRSVGAVLAYVVVLGGLTMLGVLLFPPISQQVSNFSENVPELRADVVETINDFAVEIDDRFGIEIDTEQISCLLGPEGTSVAGEFSTAECDEVTREFRERISHHAGRITEIGFSVLEGLLVFILAPLLALYILIDLPHLQRDALNLVPESHRAEFADLGSKVGRAIGGFFRGQLLVALLVGVMSSVGFWIVGLPFWLVIGAIAGFTNLIPLVGPFIGGGLGLLVGTVTEGAGVGLGAALVALVVQQIDNHVISPNVMKRTVQLHPATVMLSLLAGGTIAGFWGVLLGVPAVAVVKLLLAHFWTTRVLGEDVSPHAHVGGLKEPPSVVPDGDPEPPPEPPKG
ncbi:MAG TPA: AI-2E family transporter [Actinomycetota bacterium]|nr:AI-2E family transporter [Actinomycetota bacterium]